MQQALFAKDNARCNDRGNMANLGKRVEAARLALGWTQAALCAKVVGLSQQALDRLEKRDSVRSQFAPGLAAALNPR